MRRVGVVSMFGSRLLIMRVALSPCKLALQAVSALLQHAQPNKDVHTCTTLPMHTATPHLYNWHMLAWIIVISSFCRILFCFTVFRTEQMSHVCCPSNSILWAAQGMMNLITMTCPAHSFSQGIVLLTLPVSFGLLHVKKGTINPVAFAGARSQQWLEAQ